MPLAYTGDIAAQRALIQAHADLAERRAKEIARRAEFAKQIAEAQARAAASPSLIIEAA